MQLEGILDFLATQLWLAILVFAVIVLAMLYVFIRKYIMIFPPYEFYVHLRYGKPKKQGEGGMVIRIPFIDKVLVIDRTVQQLNIDQEAILSKEKQLVKVNCVVQWQAENAISTINNVTWKEIPVRLRAIIESVTRTACAQLTVVEILEERGKIIEAIKKELVDIIAEWGLKVNTVEIIDVQVSNIQFVKDLAKPKEAQIARDARLADIEREQTTQNADIAKERMVQLAEQEKMMVVGIQTQEQLRAVQEAERQKELSVKKIEMDRVVMERNYEKQQAEIAAAKELEVAKLNAEAEKQRKIKQEVEVQAQKILQEAQAQAQQITMQGEAEGSAIRAKLMAEAEGLMKKAEALKAEMLARQEYSPQAFARDFLEMIPAAYKNMRIGDITTFAGMGGGGSEGEGGDGTTSPLAFMGNVLLPMMMMSQIMGFDFRGMMKEALGDYATDEKIDSVAEEAKKKLVQTKSLKSADAKKTK